MIRGTSASCALAQRWFHVEREAGIESVAVAIYCNLSSNAIHSVVIKSFAHKGLAAFYLTSSKAGIQPAHAARLRRQLGQLDQSSSPADMNVYGWKLHALKGDLAGHWAVWVSGNWRITFKFDGADATVVDYQDYH